MLFYKLKYISTYTIVDASLVIDIIIVILRTKDIFIVTSIDFPNGNILRMDEIPTQCANTYVKSILPRIHTP